MNKNNNNEWDMLKIKEQKVAQIIAALIICMLFVFISGYYLGKKRALETFADQFGNDSFADKMAYSICSIYDTDKANSGTGEDEAEGEDQEQIGDSESAEQQEDAQMQEDSGKPKIRYYAQLNISTSESETRKLADQIIRKGLPVKINTIPSKTFKGKTFRRYQIVTQDYDEKQKLVNHIDKISKTIKLKDVKIKEEEIQQ